MNFKFQISNFKFFFWWFRQVTGDAAYENYLRSVVHASVGADLCVRPFEADPSVRLNGAHTPVRPDSQIMSRKEFFLDSLRRRYSTISRCC